MKKKLLFSILQPFAVAQEIKKFLNQNFSTKKKPLLIFSFLFFFCSFANAQRVLFLKDQTTISSGVQALRNHLVANGMTVDYSDVIEYSFSGGTFTVNGGTSKTLADYDVIVHMNGASYSTAMDTNGQTAIMNFVRNGGGYIGGEWLSYEKSTHTIMNDVILLWRETGVNENIQYSKVAGLSHPITDNLPSSFTTASSYGRSPGSVSNDFRQDVTVLMTSPLNGLPKPSVAIRELQKGRVVFYDHTVGNYGGTPYLNDNNMLELYLSSIRWASGGIDVTGSLCQEFNSVNFKVVYNNTSDPILSYAWSISDGTTSTSSSILSKTFSSAGDYTVTVNLSLQSGTTKSFSRIFKISPTPTTPNGGDDVFLSPGTTTATLVGNTPTSGTGTWTRVSGPNNPTLTQSGSTLNLSGLTNGQYVFRYTITANGICDPKFDDVNLYVAAVPRVSSLTASNITTNSGTLEANVTADGGAAITSRGFYYGTSPSPTTNQTIVTGTTGVMSANITGLQQGTLYYFKAFAVNSNGTTTTSDSTFRTVASTSAISVNSSSITSFSACTGSNSTEQSFSVSGVDLTSNVTVTAPTGYQVSLTSGSGYASSISITASGALSATTIYVRLASSATAGAKNGNITVVSTNATTQNVAVTGTVNAAAQLTIQNSLCANQGLYWSTWNNVTTTTATGAIGNVGVTVTHSAGGLSTTSSMFNHSTFPAQYAVPNGTTLSNDKGGTFTFTFDRPVNNPQVAFSSIGNPSTPVGLTTSVPYQVIWNGQAMTYSTTTTMTGAEGFTIVKFPGTHTSITIQYDRDETYANIAFGAENFNCSAPTVCQGQPITLTAGGGSSYQWSPSTGLSATNTAQVVATPTTTTTYTITDPSNPCASPTTITINVNPLPAAPTATALQMVCPGSTVASLQATTASGNTIEWYTTSTGGTALATTATLTPGTYYAQAVNSNSCGSLRTAVTVSTNNALHFDGVNDRVNLSSNSIQDGATAFTIEAWIKPDNSNWDNQYHALFGNQTGTPVNTRNPSFYLKDGKIHIDSYEDNTLTRYDLLTNQSLISQNVWSHIALVKDGTTFKVYINGNLAATTPAPNAVNITGPYQLGFIDNYYAGLLDEVRFWNVSRSQSDIQATMNLPLTGTETGLVDYYNFNQGIIGGNNSSLTTLLDNTSSSNNGTLVGFALSGATSNYAVGFLPQITGSNTVAAGNTIQLSHPLSGGSWSSATTGVATVNSSGLVRGISGGTSVITYTLCGQSTTFTVTVNALPTISSISTQVLCANGTASPVRFVVSDLETAVANLTVTATSSNASLLPVSSISFSGNTGARTMNYATAAGVYGSSTVTLTVADADGNTTNATFEVQVAADRIVTSTTVPTLQARTPLTLDDQVQINETGAIDGALVVISSGFVAGDVLSYTGTLPAGVTQSYNSSTGVLTFNGSLTPSQLQAIFRAVQVNTTSTNAQDRTITFNMGSALPYSVNNHFYQFITANGISWTAAKAAAEQLSFFGKQGYLATVTSAGENQFILSKIQGQGWMGASDAQTEGVWKWMTGPEAGTQFWQGLSNGNVVGGLYNNWAYGEPNNAGDEDYAHFLTNGQWNDYPLSLGGIQGYVVEFGGMANDPCVVTSATKTIRVVVNVAPTDITLSPASINENNAANAVVGTLTSTDADAGDTFTYTLVSGTGSTDNGSFTIAGNQLKATPVFNFETKNSYSVRVRTTDAGGLSFEKAFTVTVNNVNEVPTDITLSANSINENNSVGATIGNLTSTDVDAGDTFSYTLVSGTGSTDNGSFTIAGNQLKAGIAFNFEAKNSYSVRVRTTDAGGLSFEKSFTITINDVNEVPTDITLSANSINENNSVGATIGNLTSTDVDAGDTFTYTLVSGTGSTDNGSFTIAGNQLKAGIAFNFEAKNSYSVRVRTTDAGGLSFEKSFTITINDVNEVPTNIALSNANLYEGNAAGANIGSLSTTDQDAGDRHSYSLVSGDVSAFTIAGNTLKANTVFNYNNKSSYSVRVRTTDAGGLSFDKDFTVTISQVPVINGTGNQIGTTIPVPASTSPEISKGFSTQLSVIGSGYTSYSWSPATGLSSTNIANPVARPLQTTTYTLTVTNAFGNSYSLSITVVVNEDYYIKANNILTPNGDGQNDVWFVENLNNYPNHEVKIFDRNGRLLYTTRNYQNNWNGQLNGSMLAQDTYYYTITFGGNVAPKKGFITLVR